MDRIWCGLRQQMRRLHYKQNPRKYPQVKAADVVLERPRFGFRRAREPLLSQSVTDTLFPSEAIRKLYMKNGKAVPLKHRAHSDAIARRNFKKFQDEVAMGEPHFKVGHKQVYFPKARVVLLRPNAKHTPYQAKFVVPRNFNKMDLRDYLWHVYGLRALNVTVQLLPTKWTRDPSNNGRTRSPQFKKMTIDMEEPFVWPELPEGLEQEARASYESQLAVVAQQNASGSDVRKPSEAFDGLYDKPELPSKFTTYAFQRQAQKKLQQYNDQMALVDDKKLVGQYLGL